jgi:DNA-binding XRE family transcriptional regulator
MRSGKLHRLRVRQVAEQKGVSRTRLSRLTGIQYDSINAIWKNEQRDVSLSIHIKLAKALRTDVSELYEVVDDPG